MFEFSIRVYADSIKRAMRERSSADIAFIRRSMNPNSRCFLLDKTPIEKRTKNDKIHKTSKSED